MDMDIKSNDLHSLINNWTAGNTPRTPHSLQESVIVFRDKKGKEIASVLLCDVPDCCGALLLLADKPIPRNVRVALRTAFHRTGMMTLFVMPKLPGKVKKIGALGILSSHESVYYENILQGLPTNFQAPPVFGMTKQEPIANLPAVQVVKAKINKCKKSKRFGLTTLVKWAEGLYFMYGLYGNPYKAIPAILQSLKTTDRVFGICTRNQRGAIAVFAKNKVKVCYSCPNPNSNNRLYLYCGRGLDTSLKPVKLESSETARIAR